MAGATLARRRGARRGIGGGHSVQGQVLVLQAQSGCSVSKGGIDEGKGLGREIRMPGEASGFSLALGGSEGVMSETERVEHAKNCAPGDGGRGEN